MDDEEMPKRFTLSEKWENKKFRKFSPHAKLLYLYILDRCDIAGFWEIDLEQAAFSMGIEDDLEALMKELDNSYLTVTEGLVWIKNFIIHQANWPLQPNVPAHRGIIRILLSHNDFVDKALGYMEKKTGERVTKGLLNPTSISISKSISKRGVVGGGFKPPTLREVQVYVQEKGYKFVNAESFFDFYESKGWFVGKNKMKDWYKAVSGWEAREKDKHPAPTNTKSTPPLQPAICIVDHKPAHDYKLNGARQPVWLCLDCFRAIGKQDWGKMSKPEIERAVEKGKRRPPPAVKDAELAGQDKKRAAVAKIAGLGDKMVGKGK